MLTSIVILTYNKLDYTKQCVESIRKYTHKNEYELIVVDNYSVDGTVEWLKEQSDIKCIFNEINAGFPKGCNQGIEIATGDNILLLNNDVIVTENWLQNLVTALYSEPTIGAVGPVTNSAAYYSTIPVSFRTLDEMQSFAKNYNITDSNEWEERVKLIGFCMLIKREVIEKVGLLDEIFSPGNFEDDDYSFRIQLAGYKLLICKDTFIYHYGSQSWRDKPDEYYNLLKENERKFIKKWGFNPGYSTFIRNEIINLIEEPAEKNINVLEVGCACGATLLKIKNKYKNAEIHGIELNENAANIAKLYANVTDQNIENAELQFKQNYFDYIIFADVLEHLFDPWKVLKEIKKYLNADGKILISIPNVMHFSLLKQVINGKWTYSESGLLDRTHVRFFTLHEIIKALEDAGYKNVEYQMITVPKSPEDQEFITKLSELSNENLIQQYEAYQYI
ncbi:glycosyltransferase, partial [Neobacillus sp. SM06]|uniref:glycosyltransferase n=1 Tax=Neobacillus sp. SM06 TaxID=3422492 RepID=UPI003D2A5639